MQVLLLRPQNEKEASVISIWHRLVNTLIENVLTPPPTPATETDNEGKFQFLYLDACSHELNVEILWLLGYLVK